jgi:hypothetical protein
VPLCLITFEPECVGHVFRRHFGRYPGG